MTRVSCFSSTLHSRSLHYCHWITLLSFFASSVSFSFILSLSYLLFCFLCFLFIHSFFLSYLRHVYRRSGRERNPMDQSGSSSSFFFCTIPTISLSFLVTLFRDSMTLFPTLMFSTGIQTKAWGWRSSSFSHTLSSGRENQHQRSIPEISYLEFRQQSQFPCSASIEVPLSFVTAAQPRIWLRRSPCRRRERRQHGGCLLRRRTLCSQQHWFLRLANSTQLRRGTIVWI